jgi:hypothetical protein
MLAIPNSVYLLGNLIDFYIVHSVYTPMSTWPARRFSPATVLVPRYGYIDLFESQYITPEKRIGVYHGRKIRVQKRQ